MIGGEGKRAEGGGRQSSLLVRFTLRISQDTSSLCRAQTGVLIIKNCFDYAAIDDPNVMPKGLAPQ
jgi:hypothetical protein